MLALSLAKYSGTQVDRNADELARPFILVRVRLLVALGMTKSTDAKIGGDADKAIRASLLVAVGTTKDTKTEVKGNVD